MSGSERTTLMTVVVIAAVLIGFAVFFIGFLVAPLALLLVLYLALSTSDRAHRRRRLRAAGISEADEEPS
jgi:hypothetical protein